MRRRFAFSALVLASVLLIGAFPRLRAAVDAVSSTPLAPAPGRLLVARPTLRDGRFFKTVILLVRSDAGGTAGIVVNRPPAAAAGDRRFWGGPLAPGRTAALSYGDHAPDGSVAVLPNVHLLLQARGVPPRSRRFAGYASWGPGQLAGELARGDWIVLPGEARWALPRDPGSVWAELLSTALREALR